MLAEMVLGEIALGEIALGEIALGETALGEIAFRRSVATPYLRHNKNVGNSSNPFKIAW